MTSPTTFDDNYCCGLHAVCEKRSWREAAAANLYFDDEELDAFSGRPSDAYTEAEIDLFRDVLYTMRTDEIPEWLDCLEQRGVNLPAELQQESTLLISELA